MKESKEMLVSYVVATRYVARWGAKWDSSVLPVGEYQTYAETENVTTRMMPSKLANSYKPKKNYILVEIRLELYRRTQKRDQRLRCLSFWVRPIREQR